MESLPDLEDIQQKICLRLLANFFTELLCLFDIFILCVSELRSQNIFIRMYIYIYIHSLVDLYAMHCICVFQQHFINFDLKWKRERYYGSKW